MSRHRWAAPYLDDGDVVLYAGDCVEVMRGLPEASVDAVVTDPPYGLEFMGKEWDRLWSRMDGEWSNRPKGGTHPFAKDRPQYVAGPRAQEWHQKWAAEAFRVLKPGGHLLAFGGTRTYHRLACAIEDAGFEVRDCLVWLYGSGFPKSLDVSKAIDKAAGAEREVVGVRPGSSPGRTRMPSGAGMKMALRQDKVSTPEPTDLTAPATPAAAAWAGWGTALKPGFEPVIVASKPRLPSDECETMGSHLATLEARLWSLLSAKDAAESFGSSPAEHDAACASARWTADERSRTRAALSDQMDTSRFVAAVSSCLSTVRSWRTTLDDDSIRPNTSTTETGSSTTTDWRTLRFCASVLTPSTIIPAAIAHGGSWWRALPAARTLNAAALSFAATRELSALVPAMSTWRASSLGEDGRCLSPAHEPIILARKPLAERTVAAQVLATGTGAINVDGCRIGTEGGTRKADPAKRPSVSAYGDGLNGGGVETINAGRWPANVVLDEEAARGLDAEVGERTSGSRKAGDYGRLGGHGRYGEWDAGPMPAIEGDTGGPSRFYFVARDDEEATCQTPVPASSAARRSSPPSGPGGSAPSGAATSAPLATPSSSPAPCTSGTVSGSRPSAASGTPAIPSTAPASSPASPAVVQTLFPTPASDAAPSAPTGITTTTVAPRPSDGSAAPATSASTSPSGARGVPASRAGEASAERLAPLPGERRPGGRTGSGAVGGRAFYTAKAGADEREGSKHPTVKPLALMRWLVRLVTPPGGVVLDPFAGSGTTLRAAREEGFRAIGIEREAEYLADAAHRLRQLSLFAEGF